MRWKLPRGVHRYETRHGKTVFYFRQAGRKKVRLELAVDVLPWSPKFMAAYEAAKADEAAPSIGASRTIPGTLNAAIVGYYQASSFKDGLAKSTQTSRRAILERFREQHGDKRVALMHTAALQTIINGKSPAAQRNWVKALRGFVDHCLSLKIMRSDPLAGVKLLKMKTTGHHPWETSECERFEAHHAVGTRARLAYELLLQAGQSKCDVVRMGRQHIRKGMMTMRRQKTGVPFTARATSRLWLSTQPPCRSRSTPSENPRVQRFPKWLSGPEWSRAIPAAAR
jgi:hypothetical protein